MPIRDADAIHCRVLAVTFRSPSGHLFNARARHIKRGARPSSHFCSIQVVYFPLDRVFSKARMSLLLRLYGHGNLAVEAYVQQLKNSVNIDMRRGGLSEFKVNDPIIIRIGGQIILGNLVLSTLN